MNKWPILVALIFALADQTLSMAQEPRMPEPKWAVGDMWTHATQVPDQPRQIATTVVIGVRDNDYTIRTIQPDGHYRVSSIPRGTMTISSNTGTITWPLSIGQRWSGSYLERSTNPPTPVKQDITVDAYELITVPAGTLGAFRLVIRACVDAPQGACGTIRLWAAPQAKHVAKLEIDREQVWGASGGTTVVLVDYAIAP